MAGTTPEVQLPVSFFGDDEFPVEWESEEEKQLHWWWDDLHCPQPLSPMWFDLGGWWSTCAYMFRRFGAPFAVDWKAKLVNGYLYTAVVPPDPKYAQEIAPYYGMVMPIYAERGLEWWENRLRPEILRNFEYLDNFPYDSASLPELMVLFEDALDIQERHWRIHWILNLSQFQASLDFQNAVREVIGEVDKDLLGRIMVSDDDRNWDAIRELWEAKERVKRNAVLTEAFSKETPREVLEELEKRAEGREFLRWLDEYKREYGNKAVYSHEYVYVTWRENPAPIIAAIQGYLATDYSFPEALQRLREDRDAAIRELMGMIPPDDARGREIVQAALDRVLRMMPLTPDHHFYIDQGTYARMRYVLLAIGRRLVEAGLLDQPDDTIFLKYHELRVLAANPGAIPDAKEIVRQRREARERAMAIRPREWIGTVTHWSLYEEPYKQGLWGYPQKFYDSLKREKREPSARVEGLPASPGVAEGIARVVLTPEELDAVKDGEILVCRMTNPAWVVAFTKIAGLVTDSGGQLSHPAVVSREFGIPAVVGTTNATQMIKTGARVRVNGNTGVVEILG
jgi:phosphohistidine swiveling domain-containing protein